MTLQTRFGRIEIDKDKIIEFKEGIPGFETLRKFILIEDEESKFCYLQSVEEGAIAFTIISPEWVKSDYTPCIGESYFEKLGGGKTEDFVLYNIVAVRQPIEETTVNLQAPLLIHTTRRLGVQAIVEGKDYQVRHKLIELIELIQERG